MLNVNENSPLFLLFGKNYFFEFFMFLLNSLFLLDL